MTSRVMIIRDRDKMGIEMAYDSKESKTHR